MTAYACANLTPLQIMQRAVAVLNKPNVRNYIRDLRTEVSGAALFDIQQMVNELVQVITASPAEIIGWHVGACRHCYGHENRYQWIDVNELAEAQARAIDGGARSLPDAAGGFGYVATARPHPKCPYCNGKGEGRVHLTDTRELSPAALRLYQGVKIGSNGQIEVKMRSQDEAMKMLMRIYGVYNPAAMLAPPKLAKDQTPAKQAETRVDVPQSPQEAAEYYANFISGKELH